MALPEFTHIHCSSRFDRSAASLESDVDQWRQESSIITLTEVSNDRRGATLREDGWGYARSKKDFGRDECAVCYRRNTWGLEYQGVLKLNTRGRVYAGPVCCCDAILKHKDSGHRLLISVTHLPAHVEGYGGQHWRTQMDHWEARRAAYLSSIQTWQRHIKNLDASKKPDAIMVVADWNLNLKRNWVRDLLHDSFGYRQAWVRFPTSGGSLHGGPVVPLAAPGKGNGDRIIDGTLYKGKLSVETEPNLMATARSSDHRPYKERFAFTKTAVTPPAGTPPADGDVGDGPTWWGFGDYIDDEIYSIDYQETESV